MNTNFRQIIGMPKLLTVLGVTSSKELDARQRRAARNIKYCAGDQWSLVNGWYDERNEDYRSAMLDARGLFNTIYTDSMENVYSEGCCAFGKEAQAIIRDIRFCGKSFLETVSLYHTAKLMEEAFNEVEGTEEDAARIIADLQAIKSEISIYVR